MEGHVPHDRVELIDVRFKGLDRVICCWRIDDVLVDPGPESSVENVLAALGEHVTLAPTPPPDIDVEAWDASLDLIATWQPTSLGLTHFGGVDEVEEQLEATRSSLHELAELTRNAGPATVGAAVRDRVDRTGDRYLRAAYGAAVPAEHIYLGLERYWRKRAEREATVQSA